MKGNKMLTDKLRTLTPYLMAGAVALGAGCKKEEYEIKRVSESSIEQKIEESGVERHKNDMAHKEVVSVPAKEEEKEIKVIKREQKIKKLTEVDLQSMFPTILHDYYDGPAIRPTSPQNLIYEADVNGDGGKEIILSRWGDLRIYDQTGKLIYEREANNVNGSVGHFEIKLNKKPIILLYLYDLRADLEGSEWENLLWYESGIWKERRL